MGKIQSPHDAKDESQTYCEQDIVSREDKAIEKKLQKFCHSLYSLLSFS
jgi:hypothetical protein